MGSLEEKRYSNEILLHLRPLAVLGGALRFKYINKRATLPGTSGLRQKRRCLFFLGAKLRLEKMGSELAPQSKEE
jgi:hypothetical protein